MDTTTENTSVLPVWDEVKTALCVSSSDEYAPYLCVYLRSIIENSKRKRDIVVFERKISEENKQTIIRSLTDSDTSIRFVNPAHLFEGVELHISHDYFKEECYYRIAAPKLLSSYDKVIFTDLDLIATDDIFKLADIDTQGKPIAACIEPMWRDLYQSNCRIHHTDIQSYTNRVLNLSNPFQYYNTGVVVFDVKEYNQFNSFERLLEIVKTKELLYQEQCALNILFQGNFYTLPSEWNYELDPTIVNNTQNHEFYNSYKESEGAAKIFHYLGRYKPWKNALEYKAGIWWNYAKATPFYEVILTRMIDFRASQSQNNEQITLLRKEFEYTHFPNINYQSQMLYLLTHKSHFRMELIRCAIMKLVTSGKKREKYSSKYEKVKKMLRDAKDFRRRFTHI